MRGNGRVSLGLTWTGGEKRGKGPHPWKTPKETQKGSLEGGIRLPGCSADTRSHTTSSVSGSSAASGNVTACAALAVSRPAGAKVGSGGGRRTAAECADGGEDGRVEDAAVKVEADDVDVEDPGGLAWLDDEGREREDVRAAWDSRASGVRWARGDRSESFAREEDVAQAGREDLCLV